MIWKKLKRFVIRILFLIAAVAGVLYYNYPKVYEQEVYTYAKEFNLDPLLVYSVMKVESNFNTDAISYKGAKGLLQIMDSTGAWGSECLKMTDYDHDQLFVPEVNIRIGCWYLSKLINQYDGDINKALAAYNAGSGNVAKWMNNSEYSRDGKTLSYIPFKETRTYINKVNFHHKMYTLIYRE